MLVMKALSLGLVKGSIDEVDNKVHLTWVQPRVLDLEQVRFYLLSLPIRISQVFIWVRDSYLVTLSYLLGRMKNEGHVICELQ